MSTLPPRATVREVTRPPEPVRGPAPARPRRPAVQQPPSPAQRVVPGKATGGSFWRQERESFGYAFQGLSYAWATQRHLRIHVALSLLATGLGLVFGISPVEWAALVAVVVLVIALELLNTVVESVVDLVTREVHPLAKTAKDVAAASVLVAAGGALLTGALIFVPRLLSLALEVTRLAGPAAGLR